MVLGSPTAGDRLTAVGEERVRAGVELWRRGLAPVLCFSGGGGEAALMVARARELGVPGDAIRLEPTARNTRENAYAAGELLAAEGRQVVWVVTQPFHLRRAAYWLKRAGLEPRPWLIEDSVQYRRPERALRWIGREYAAWAALALNRLSGR